MEAVENSVDRSIPLSIFMEVVGPVVVLDVTGPTDRKMCTSPWYGIRRAGSRDPIKPVDVGVNLIADYHRPLGMELLALPCGQCFECRMARARDWSVRAVLEARQWQHNYFLTLTYDDQHVPVSFDRETGEERLTLHMDHVSQFMKRLRAWMKDHYDHEGIRFFAASEYGDRTFRPHYHMLLFNCPLPDLRFYSVNFQKDVVYTSETLRDLWQHGQVIVGDLTINSAGYVARYCLNKLTGPAGEFYYRHGIEPEQSRMSRRPGIAQKYFDEESGKIYASDRIFLVDQEGHPFKVRPPRYFDKLAEKIMDLDKVKVQRLRNAQIREDQLLRSSDLPLSVLLDRKNMIHIEAKKLLTKHSV